MLFLGIKLTFVAYEEYKMQTTSNEWLTTTGVILYSDVKTFEGKKVQTSQREIKRTFDIEYEYSVDETVYRGNRLSFGGTDVSEAGTKQLLRSYKSGQGVIVYYDPDSPANSVLSINKGGAWLVVGSFSLLLLSISCWMLAQLIRKFL